MQQPHSFAYILEIINDYPSVKLYRELQLLKQAFINDIAEGNQVNDFEILQDKDLKTVYLEMALSYRFRLGINNDFNKERIKAEIKYFKEQARHEDLAIKKSQLSLPQKEMQSNNLSFECVIHWQAGETFRELKVIRSNKSGKREIVTETVKKGSKITPLNESSLRTNVQIGRPDLAFYDFFLTEYLLKNSRVFQSLLELELMVGTEIQRQWEEYQQQLTNNTAAAQLNGTNTEESHLDLRMINSKLRTLKEIWSLSKNRHALVFDYSMALCYIEDNQALYSQLLEVEKEGTSLPASDTKGQSDWLNYLSKKMEEGLIQQRSTLLYYRAIKETFYDDYNTLRKKMNDKLKKVEDWINTNKTRKIEHIK